MAPLDKGSVVAPDGCVEGSEGDVDDVPPAAVAAAVVATVCVGLFDVVV